jgi:hypothetical protein
MPARVASPSPRTEQGSSRFIAFFDECGDHSLTVIDQDFPLFLLATVVVERAAYVQEIVPRVTRLKLDYWDHEGVNLHSRDIRKAEGPFSILQRQERRQGFMADLTSMMEELPFTLFVTAIRKEALKERYSSRAKNPYELAVTYTFERIVHFLEQHEEIHLPVVAESRGRGEDRNLEVAFYRMFAEGTQFVGPDRLSRLRCPLLFENKLRNICGVQLADLCAHPCARHVLKPAQPSRAYEIASRHLYSCDHVTGWKVFP